jgi:N-acetylglucosaminyl-diphospho-decaprenol L-rhamnosyltransferase
VSRFAVVTVIHQSESDLGRMLASIEAHLDPRPRVVVVDSGSTDRGPEIAREWGAEVVRLAENRGFGAACNEGLASVGEPVTALVNPDVELLDAGLATIARMAEAKDAIFAPRLLNDDGSVQDSAHPRPGTVEQLVPAIVPRPLLPPPLRRRYEPWREERPRRVGWAVGAALVARTALLRRLGPFDPEAFLFYEDLELCLRAARAGVPTCLHPEVALAHRGGASTGPVLGDRDLLMRARRRREVVAQEGALRLRLDDLAQAATFAGRAAARRLLRRGGDRELAQLRALLTARRETRG